MSAWEAEEAAAGVSGIWMDQGKSGENRAKVRENT